MKNLTKVLAGIAGGIAAFSIGDAVGYFCGTRKAVKVLKEVKEDLDNVLENAEESKIKSAEDLMKEVEEEMEIAQENVDDFIEYAEEAYEEKKEEDSEIDQEARELVETAKKKGTDELCFKFEVDQYVGMKDFTKLYSMFEDRYNKYPVQMARYEAFRNAEEEGFITEEFVNEAKKYYGKLWNYVGD